MSLNKEIDNKIKFKKQSKVYSIPLSNPLTPKRIAEYLRSDRPASLRFISNVLRIPLQEIINNLRQAKELGLVESSEAGWWALRQ